MGETSAKQNEANRRNAKRSTGPRSARGKAASGRNALKHGLTAAEVVLPDESEAAFEAFRGALFDELDPGSVFEAALADDIAALMWRMRRCHRIEARLVQLRQAQDGVKREQKARGLKASKRLVAQFPALYGEDERADEGVRRAERETAKPHLALARAFLIDLAKEEGLAKLSRYETTLRRNLERALVQFERARQRRLRDASGRGGETDAVALPPLLQTGA